LKQEKNIIPEDIHAFAQAREKARTEKDFAESDRLRDLISARGYKVEDTASGYQVKKI
jgi:cysteinyl-tRNA synthetase